MKLQDYYLTVKDFCSYYGIDRLGFPFGSFKEFVSIDSKEQLGYYLEYIESKGFSFYITRKGVAIAYKGKMVKIGGKELYECSEKSSLEKIYVIINITFKIIHKNERKRRGDTKNT